MEAQRVGLPVRDRSRAEVTRRTPLPNDRRLIAFGAAVATCLSGLDLAVVATAMPTVVVQLGGLDLYAWTFSAYLLSSTIAILIYGRLADLYGRKLTFLVATGLFLLGSALCGVAQSMPQLIGARFLQGLGGGGVYPITLTIVGDVFELEARARLLGLLAAIWGVSAVVGPAIGGFVTEQLSWRWAFLLQLPLALLAMAIIARYLHERVLRTAQRFDFLGSLLLAGSIACLLLGLQGVWSGLLVGAGLAIGVAFVVQEGHTPAPLLPLQLFRSRAIAVGSAACAVSGVMLYGQDSFAPPLLQGVLGASPSLAGLTLSCTSIGWPIASVAFGRMLHRWGYRVSGVFGGVFLVLGFVALQRVTADTSLGVVATIETVLGAGFGFVTPVALLSMQNAVGWAERGVATGANQFATSLGGALGVAIAGALFASGVRAGDPLAAALSPVFRLFLLTAVVSLGILALLPRRTAT